MELNDGEDEVGAKAATISAWLVSGKRQNVRSVTSRLHTLGRQ